MTSQNISTFLQQTLALLGRLVALLATLLLCVPVLLLPQATAVPAWVWIPLGAINVALLVLLLVQFALGVLTVLSGFGLGLAVAHSVCATALLAAGLHLLLKLKAGRA